MKAKLVEFTFPVSGKIVFLPKVSVGGLSLKLQRKYPRPSPPIEDIDFGDGVTRKEFNYLHPDYALKVKEWNTFLEMQATQLGLNRLFSIELNAEQKKEVKAWKKDNPTLWDEYDDDPALWFEEIAIEEDADLEALINYMLTGDPTPEGIADTAESF